MKQKITLIDTLKLCVFGLFIFVNKSSFCQTSFNLNFYGDTNITVLTFVDNDPEHIQKNFLGIGIMGIRLGEINNEVIGAAPANIGFNYQRFIKSTNNCLQLSAEYFPIDANFMGIKSKYRFPTLGAEMGFTKTISSFKKKRITRFNFIDEARQLEGYDLTIHYAKLPHNFKVSYNVRGGVMYNQYTSNSYIPFYLSKDSTSYNIHGIKTGSIYLGISRYSLNYIHYKSEDFGEQKASWWRDIYLDLIYAPINNAFGEYRREGSVKLFEEGNLNSFNNGIKSNNFGMRLGMLRKASLTNFKLGVEYKLEYCILPAVQTNFNYFGFAIKLFFAY